MEGRDSTVNPYIKYKESYLLFFLRQKIKLNTNSYILVQWIIVRISWIPFQSRTQVLEWAKWKKQVGKKAVAFTFCAWKWTDFWFSNEYDSFMCSTATFVCLYVCLFVYVKVGSLPNVGLELMNLRATLSTNWANHKSLNSTFWSNFIIQ